MTDPKPERVCANCVHFKLFSWSEAFGDCLVSDHLPPCLSVLRMGATETGAANTCVLFRLIELSCEEARQIIAELNLR